MNTLLLDRTTWDFCKDASGNIAMASDPYAVAQDVASAIRLFAGELWYDTTKGTPYFSDTLGQGPSAQFLKTQFIKAALTVPEVASADCFLGFDANSRTVSGQVQVSTTAGETFTVLLGATPSPGISGGSR